MDAEDGDAQYRRDQPKLRRIGAVAHPLASRLAGDGRYNGTIIARTVDL